MSDVQLKLNASQAGSFFILDGAEQIAKMVVEIDGNFLTVYHTEVAPKAEGKGLAGQLLKAMVEYARQHQLKVIPLCPYVHAQFRRHPEQYQDIWQPA